MLISEVDPRADNLLLGAAALAVAAAVKSSPLGLARQKTGAGWGKTEARPDFHRVVLARGDFSELDLFR
jgi:hypothetical protein